jgi:hypothetical protein
MVMKIPEPTHVVLVGLEWQVGGGWNFPLPIRQNPMADRQM